ncbi:MAG: ATP-binding protein [Trichodesmium sp. MAG_R01]|nr:ATP-binding protein [Trichodesmium sp. MAG_R01]
MPRADKIGAFRQVGGEKNSSNNNGVNDTPGFHNSRKSSDSEQPESNLDFTPYLRESKYTLKDVILPQTTKNQIDLILAEIEYQDLIYKEWGMGEKHKLDKALSINFSGLPGKGKTLTAEALAHALKLKILVVPYQQLESKYVGKTPKNIAKAFEFASSNNAVLFFDEADSFLGKRLENVTQATDTAVNLTRSVMLMQLSSYEGIVIFATNLIRNYDPAFISRIRWKTQFDLPDEEARAKIWQAQIPSKLPLDENSVDFSELAKQFDEISGRDIKNAVFKAVVAAAREDKPKEQKCVAQSHFAQAITKIIEANKVASTQQVKLTPVDDTIQLPPQPNAENDS